MSFPLLLKKSFRLACIPPSCTRTPISRTERPNLKREEKEKREAREKRKEKKKTSNASLAYPLVSPPSPRIPSVLRPFRGKRIRLANEGEARSGEGSRRGRWSPDVIGNECSGACSGCVRGIRDDRRSSSDSWREGGREAGEGRTTGVTVAGITSHVCGPKKKEGRDGERERRGGGGEKRRERRRRRRMATTPEASNSPCRCLTWRREVAVRGKITGWKWRLLFDRCVIERRRR